MQSIQSHSFQNGYAGGQLGIPSWMGSTLGTYLQERPESPKTIIRCSACRLVQFETRSGCCRRCDHPLPPVGSVAMQVQAEADSMPSADTTVVPGKRSRRDWSTGLRQAVARRTRQRRLELGVSQVRFARMLGIPRSYLSRVENEHLLPGPAMLARFAEYLGIEFSSIWEAPPAGELPTDRTSGEILAAASRLPMTSLGQLLRKARQMAITTRPATTEDFLQVA